VPVKILATYCKTDIGEMARVGSVHPAQRNAKKKIVARGINHDHQCIRYHRGVAMQNPHFFLYCGK
jgi:hypothetical protein